jgi:CBS domain-containing protein
MSSHRPVKVADAMRPSAASVNETAAPRGILAAMDQAGLDELPVVATDGAFRGMVDRRGVERRLYDRGGQPRAAAIAAAPVARATREEPIEDAVSEMLAADLGVVPVVSARGQLEGLLVLEDVKHVTGLVEAVAENRRQRAIAAGAGVAKVGTACSLVSGGLGVALFALWVMGPVYGLPNWIGWVDAVAAALALIGAGAAFAREMISVPLWAISGVGLCFTALLAHAGHASPWWTGVHLVLGLVFLVMSFALGSAPPQRRYRAISHRVAAHRLSSTTR